MFRYLKVRNYKSLVNVEFNLMNMNKRAKNPKKLAVVYGENGAGKSNLANVFYTLGETLNTMNVRSVIQKYLEKVNDNIQDEDNETDEFIKFMNKNFKNTDKIIQRNKTIDSKENMYLEFGFEIDNDNGEYIIEMNDYQIVKEKLNFKIEKNKGNYFEITNNDVKLNSKIAYNKDYYDEILNNIEKFWGKHSLLSILLNEINDKAEGYVETQLNKNVIRVIDFFNDCSCRVKIGNKIERAKVGFDNQILKYLEHGEVPCNEEEQLDKAESLLNEFFTTIYADIKEVYYKKEFIDDNKIKYNLICRKIIGDEIREIDFNLESTGTQQLLDLLPYLLAAVDGKVIVLDEFDSGIHDLLVSNILSSINESINGQLIITTHNTMIMESDIDKNSLYFMAVDFNGRKKIMCLSDFEERTYPTSNIRNRYLKGMYNGIPSMMNIDFDELLDMLDN